VNLWWSGLIGVRMPATVPLRYRGPREVNPLRGSAKDQGVACPARIAILIPQRLAGAPAPGRCRAKVGDGRRQRRAIGAALLTGRSCSAV
jgi:hypothetical protein